MSNVRYTERSADSGTARSKVVGFTLLAQAFVTPTAMDFDMVLAAETTPIYREVIPASSPHYVWAHAMSPSKHRRELHGTRSHVGNTGVAMGKNEESLDLPDDDAHAFAWGRPIVLSPEDTAQFIQLSKAPPPPWLQAVIDRRRQ